MEDKQRMITIMNCCIQYKLVPMALKGKIPVTVAWQKNITLNNCNKFIEDAIASNRCNNIGIICGKISGIIVLDIDVKDNGIEEWDSLCTQYGYPKTFCVQTGSGGYHYYFKYDDKTKHLKTGARIVNGKGIDLRADGGQVVSFGSIHPDTNERYTIKEGLDNEKGPIINEMPTWLLNVINKNKENKENKQNAIHSGTTISEFIQYKLTGQPIKTKTPQNPLKSSCLNIKKTSNDNICYGLDKYPKTTEKRMRKVISKIIDLLSPRRSYVYGDWTRGIWAIKSTNTNFLDLAHKFSSKCPEKYDKNEVDKVWENGKRGSVTIGTLLYWLKQDISEEEYTNFKNKWLPSYNTLFKIYINKSDSGFSRYLKKELKGNIISPDFSAKTCYLWNKKLLTWQMGPENILTTKIDKILDSLTENAMKYYIRERKKLQEEESKTEGEPKETSVSKDTSKSKESKAKEYAKKEKRCLKFSDRLNSYDGSIKIAKYLLNRTVDTDFPKKLNSIIDLLPIRDGKIIDLRTGIVRKRTKKDVFTIECDVSYDENIIKQYLPDVLKFVSNLMTDDVEKIDFFQRILGYAITGDMSLKKMFIFWNETGNNGKTTLLLILEKILGDFYRAVNKQIFFNHKRSSEGSANPFMADLVHRRIISLSETSSDGEEKLNESLIKALTGGDTQNTRNLWQKSFVFSPYMKPILICNELPKCSTDPNLWNRLLLISFKTIFVDEIEPNNPFHRLKDPNIPNLINTEGFKMAFLYWMVQGSIKFFNEGIKIPQSVKDDIDFYKKSQDPIQRFLDDCCETKQDSDINATELYNMFCQWKSKDIEPFNQTKFGRHLSEKLHIEKGKDKYNYVVYKNIAFKPFQNAL